MASSTKNGGICLELITDPLMYNMFELGIRGGISMVSKNMPVLIIVK